MKQRILTAVIGIPLLVVVLLFSHTPVLSVVLALFSAIGAYEMVSCIGMKKKPSVAIPAIVFSALVPLSVRYLVGISERVSYFLAVFAAAAFVYIFYFMCLAVISKGTKTISDMALCAVSTIYITVGFTGIILLRDVSYSDSDFGFYLFILLFVGAWIPDGAGYFVGRAFGKHKLIPEVSPKKTVEGAIGGVIGGAVSFVVFGLIMSIAGLSTVNYIGLALTGLLVAVISIFGDLIASLVKRQYGIKDYGKLFPGHGGVMDRFDSIIAVAPFLLMICSHPEVFALLG